MASPPPRIFVEVEVCLTPSSTARPSEIRERVLAVLQKSSNGRLSAGPIPPSSLFADEFLSRHVRHARVCDFDRGAAAEFDGAGAASASLVDADGSAPFSACELRVFVFQLNEEGGEDGDTGGGDGDGGGGEGPVVAQYTHWVLPAAEFEGTWESLLYDDDEEEAAEAAEAEAAAAAAAVATTAASAGGTAAKRARVGVGANPAQQRAEGPDAGALRGARLKPALLQYASSAMLFSDSGVNGSLISWNHVILLHGPPGTGKTSLCKALAHKLSIRLGARYPAAQLIEINAHSLFSRWFSESGKLVHKLFAHIREMVEDQDSLVILLIDEVESLTAARKAAVSGSEPSDAVRVVNAVLTAIDSFRSAKNVLLLTTSNVSEAIDVAFVDRADIKALVGPPGIAARYDILSSCVSELARVGLVCYAAGTSALASSHAAKGFAEEAAAAASAATDSMAIEAAGGGGGAGLSRAAVDVTASVALWQAAVCARGFSGRALRKLPLAAHALYARGGGFAVTKAQAAISASAFVAALAAAVSAEKAARVSF